ncbi:MAG: hypothetical protein FWG68_04505 [Defluviitaleaceae bacterium]|nr:hypothetical protein [Defluviitaleaceae bacterium]
MKDLVILQKINNYLVMLEKSFLIIENMEEKDFLKIESPYAITQYLINIHSLHQLLSDELADELKIMSTRNFNKCRNISAHHYDSLDWSLVKSLCVKLLSTQTKEILKTLIQQATEELKKSDIPNKN